MITKEHEAELAYQQEYTRLLRIDQWVKFAIRHISMQYKPFQQAINWRIRQDFIRLGVGKGKTKTRPV